MKLNNTTKPKLKLWNSFKQLVDTYRTYGDELIRMVHHGDEEIEQDNDVNQRKATEHDETPEPGELLDAS